MSLVLLGIIAVCFVVLVCLWPSRHDDIEGMVDEEDR